MGWIKNALRAMSGRAESSTNRKRPPRRRLHPGSDYNRTFNMGVVDNLFPSTGGSQAGINADLFQHNQTMRSRARDEAQNTPIAKRALNEIRRNVVGRHGQRLQPQFLKADGKPDQFDNRVVKEAFAEWSKKGVCDVTGRLSFADIQRIATTSERRDGEIFVRMVQNWKGNRFGMALQVIEADRVGDRDIRTLGNGNTVLMGIEVNEWMAPIAYHVAKTTAVNGLWSNAPVLHDDTIRIPVEEMIHHFIPERAEQLRGYTFMSAAFRVLHMARGLEEAEVIAARIAADKQGIIVTPDGMSFDGDDEEEDGTIIIDSEPGGWDQVPAGTKIESWDPQHPNSDVAKFLEHLSHTMAAGLDTQHYRLTTDLKGASFSSMKHGHANDVDIFGELQSFLVDGLCTPVYQNWLDSALLHDALNLPMRKREKYDAIRWNGPVLASVDPLKDATANKVAIANGDTTVTEIAARKGRTLEEVLDEREKELEAAAKRGISLDGPTKPAIVLGGDSASMGQESFSAMIEIVEKASTGTIPKASALALLVKLGLEETEAAEILSAIPDPEDPGDPAED